MYLVNYNNNYCNLFVCDRVSLKLAVNYVRLYSLIEFCTLNNMIIIIMIIIDTGFASTLY